MSQTDPIADMLTRIRNAVQARKKEVSLPSSGIKIEIAKILREEGFIRNYKVIEDKKQGILNITLKYAEDNQNVITGIRRVSSPGCRIYCTKDSVPKVLDGLGTRHRLHFQGADVGPKMRGDGDRRRGPVLDLVGS